MIYNITGLRVQVTARIDRTGYDVTKSESSRLSFFSFQTAILTICLVGPYPVRSGQRVFIKDPEVSPIESTGSRGGATTHQIPTRSHNPGADTPDVYLRFSHSLSGGEEELAALPDAYKFPIYKETKDGQPSVGIMVDALAATATFGGNPGVPRMQASPNTTPTDVNRKRKKVLFFGPESPFNGAIHVVRPEDHNLEGCEDHHPGLRFNYMIPPQQFFAAPDDVPSPPHLTTRKSHFAHCARC